MSHLAEALTTVEAERLRMLYLRRRQVEKAISALEQLVEVRDSRTDVVTIDKLRLMLGGIN